MKIFDLFKPKKTAGAKTITGIMGVCSCCKSKELLTICPNCLELVCDCCLSCCKEANKMGRKHKQPKPVDEGEVTPSLENSEEKAEE